MPAVKKTVIKDEWRVILFSNFKGIITQLDIKVIMQGRRVRTGFHIFSLKIEYKDKQCKIQKKKQ